MVGLSFTEDVTAAAAALGPFLRRDPARNNLALTLLDRQAKQPEDVARFWWSGTGDEIGGLCLQVGSTRGVHVLTDDLDLAARFAVEIAATFPEVSGVHGLTASAAAFAAAWAAERHIPVTTGMFQRYYILDTLIPPPPGSGSIRQATIDDIDTILPWAVGFQQDAHGRGAPETTVDVPTLTEAIRWKIEHAEVWLWDDGGPRAMAGATPLIEGVSRLHLVYTPPENRNRGFGALCTAGTVTQLLQSGATHCVLFTDLANPTSNALYERLGFKPACECLHLDFG